MQFKRGKTLRFMEGSLLIHHLFESDYLFFDREQLHSECRPESPVVEERISILMMFKCLETFLLRRFVAL